MPDASRATVRDDACRELRAAIRGDRPLADDTLQELLRQEPSLADSKRLLSGLLGCRLVTLEQAAVQVYLQPQLREA